MKTLQMLRKEGEEALRDLPEGKTDARLLLEDVLGMDTALLLAEASRAVTSEEETAYRESIQRRANREPLAYITGRQGFMGLDFFVTRDVLIPNRDTECLVEEAEKRVKPGMHVLDLCTGSGCVLLSLIKRNPGITGTGTDISPAALRVAESNAERLGAAEQVTFMEADLFEGIEGRFDLITANPPYVATGVIGTLEPEVRVHEPALALDGGEDGLHIYRRLIPEAFRHLKAGGSLLLEIGYDQAEAVCALLTEAGFRDVFIRKDYAGLARVAGGSVPGADAL